MKPIKSKPTPQVQVAGKKPVPRPSHLRFEDRAYVHDLFWALQQHDGLYSKLTIFFISLLVVFFIFWADATEIDEVTVGMGKVVASSGDQIIQSLEGGILEQLLVREGQMVTKDQELVRLDATRFRSNAAEGQGRYLALSASLARLQAEANGTALVFPDFVKRDLPTAVQNETMLYQSRQRALRESITSLTQSLELAEKELTLNEPLLASGVVAQTDVLRLKRQINDIASQITEKKNKFKADANFELTKTVSEINALNAANIAKKDQVRRTVLRSPAAGEVKNIRFTTPGAVIQPGQDIMHLVPSEDTLLIEVKVRPQDIAFVRPGLPVTVKISAYDYSIYGGLSGQIEFISPDTLVEERRPEEAYYIVRVRVQELALFDKRGKPLPIIPGMTATADIRTGKKSVLTYILKPFIKNMNNAMHER